MVYRKTEAVLANAEAKRQSIIAATIKIIAKLGADALTTDLVAAEIEGAVGTIYRYFADKDEMIAAAMAQLLAADLAAMREASNGHHGEADLIAAIVAFYDRLRKPRLVRASFDYAFYREGIEAEIASLIKKTCKMPPMEREVAACAVVGVIQGLFYGAGNGPKQGMRAALFGLRCIGRGESAAMKALERAAH